MGAVDLRFSGMAKGVNIIAISSSDSRPPLQMKSCQLPSTYFERIVTGTSTSPWSKAFCSRVLTMKLKEISLAIIWETPSGTTFKFNFRSLAFAITLYCSSNLESLSLGSIKTRFKSAPYPWRPRRHLRCLRGDGCTSGLSDATVDHAFVQHVPRGDDAPSESLRTSCISAPCQSRRDFVAVRLSMSTAETSARAWHASTRRWVKRKGRLSMKSTTPTASPATSNGSAKQD